ncbi:MAG: sugar phosphate isomerase/epimerase, partial [Saprospiraceae bacterium]|nr:sugar phosphate isomerase/epimerase [Saprospiraceae bacterium]
HSFWSDLRLQCDDLGVRSLLMMVDDEGDLGDPDLQKRTTAVDNHKKWVHAIKTLGGHSIRVNAFSGAAKTEARAALVDGLGRLCTFAASEDIHVLIENHGLYSSDADFILGVIAEVESPFLGTLPDFGNWCMSEKWGSTAKEDCENVYDIYEGVRKYLPYAKGVSAKSYNFNAQGEQDLIDYTRMLQVVKDFGYQGYIGIEYEGTNLSEDDGIRATKDLIERAW